MARGDQGVAILVAYGERACVRHDRERPAAEHRLRGDPLVELRDQRGCVVAVAADLDQDGDIDVAAFVSHRITLDDVNRGFELMEAQDGIRSVIGFA